MCVGGVPECEHLEGRQENVGERVGRILHGAGQAVVFEVVGSEFVVRITAV